MFEAVRCADLAEGATYPYAEADERGYPKCIGNRGNTAESETQRLCAGLRRARAC